MKTNNRYGIYLFLLVLILGIVYTACKDITPEQEKITEDVTLKLSK